MLSPSHGTWRNLPRPSHRTRSNAPVPKPQAPGQPFRIDFDVSFSAPGFARFVRSQRIAEGIASLPVTTQHNEGAKCSGSTSVSKTDRDGSIPSAPANLSGSQLRFLRLHARAVVDRWQWHFQQTQLRAHSGTRRATIAQNELAELCERGLMIRGHGAAVYATPTGKALVQ
jgi:hypothetical protein